MLIFKVRTVLVLYRVHAIENLPFSRTYHLIYMYSYQMQFVFRKAVFGNILIAHNDETCTFTASIQVSGTSEIEYITLFPSLPVKI